MLKRILLGGGATLLLLGGAGFGYVSYQPDTFEVERSREIAAPVDVVFDQVNVMKARKAWYPWDQLDPDMQRTYGEIEAGVGAAYEWSGNEDVGRGRQEILQSVEYKEVVDSLEFIEPFASTNTARFTFEDLGERTRVTWSMTGGGDFSTKLMNALMDMDAMVGPDFDKGLAALDEVSQAEAKRREMEAVMTAAEEGQDPDHEPEAEEDTGE